MKTILQFIHSAIAFPGILIVTIIASALSAFFGFFNPYSKLTTGVLRWWGRSILRLVGTRVIVEGQENVKDDEAYVFAANHLGALDVPAMIALVPQTARFIAKKELFRIPLFSIGMRNSGMLKIDRGNSEEARKTLAQAIQTIKDGCSVIIFPEGTRSKTGQIMPFKKGGFVLALNGKIPIIPTTIMGTQFIVEKKNPLIRRGTIKVVFMPAIETKDSRYEQRSELVKDVRNQVVSHFDPEFNKGDL